MLKLSGLVLDIYDDPSGEVLRSSYPTLADVPDVIKTAHVLSFEDREQLPDDVFALVLQDEQATLRKFACTDAGHTQLSVDYFLKTAHKLPEEAQRIGAQNLVTACGWYGLPVREDLEKIALGLGTAMTALTLPSMVKGTKDQIGKNLQVARASGSIVNPETVAR